MIFPGGTTKQLLECPVCDERFERLPDQPEWSIAAAWMESACTCSNHGPRRNGGVAERSCETPSAMQSD